jgi:hypothetical protein
MASPELPEESAPAESAPVAPAPPVLDRDLVLNPFSE